MDIKYLNVTFIHNKSVTNINEEVMQYLVIEVFDIINNNVLWNISDDKLRKEVMIPFDKMIVVDKIKEIQCKLLNNKLEDKLNEKVLVVNSKKNKI